jgi:hypothetical protein
MTQEEYNKLRQEYADAVEERRAALIHLAAMCEALVAIDRHYQKAMLNPHGGEYWGGGGSVDLSDAHMNAEFAFLDARDALHAAGVAYTEIEQVFVETPPPRQEGHTFEDLENCIHEDIIGQHLDPAVITAETIKLLNGLSRADVAAVRRLADDLGRTIERERAAAEEDMADVIRRLGALLEPLINWLSSQEVAQ